MDPVSMTASIIAILELTATLTKSINETRHANMEQARVAVEASNLYSLLTSLRFRVEAARASDPWLNQIKLLGQPEGPLDQFREILEEMVAQLPGPRKRDHVKSVLSWTFTKKQVEEALQRMERLKSLVQCALTEDLWMLTQAIHEDVGSLAKQMKQMDLRTSQLQSHAAQEMQGRVAKWLGIPDPSVNYQAALNKRHPDTGRWLTEGQKFIDWKNAKSPLMWLHGNAGCGKTVLSAAALQEVLRLCDTNQDMVVAYFYFDFNDVEKQFSKKAVRSILYQIAQQVDSGMQSLEQLYERCGTGQQQPSDSTILALLRDTLASPSPTYVVLDALDECTDREQFLEILCSLVKLSVPSLHVLATSRRERDIEEQLHPMATHNIDIQSAIVDEDISLYVQGRLRTDPKLKKWPETVRQEISDELIKKANGMFRWAYCQLESIRRCVKLRNLREALSSLPKTLDETYERILQHLESEGHLQDAITVLRWLCFSDRPLRLTEVVEILAIETGDNGGFYPEERLPEPEDVMVVCSSLISCHYVANKDDRDESDEMDSDSSSQLVSDSVGDHTPTPTKTIRLAHFSVKEYLLSDRCPHRSIFQPSISHQLIAEGCLLYLLYTTEQGPLTKAIVLDHPLARYAAEYWWQHACHVYNQDGQSIVTLALRLLTRDDQSYLSLVQLYDPDFPLEKPNVSLKLSEVGGPLYFASMTGLASVTAAVLTHTTNVNLQGGFYYNALQAASCKGHEAVAQILLDAGADADIEVGNYSYALIAASVNGHSKVVKALLDAGANIHVQRQRGTALHESASQGHLDVVRILIARGANIHSNAGSHDATPLYKASESGRGPVVEELLAAGADPNMKGGWLGYPLIAASEEGSETVVQQLLEAGADIQAISDSDGNALGAAAREGHEKVARILLNAGITLDPVNGDFGDPLQAGSYGGNVALVQMLLDAGARVDIEGGRFGSPLQAASTNRDTKVVELLLSVGAHVNAQGGDYGSALQAASYLGSKEVVEFLLSAGADVNAQGGKYGTALQGALKLHRDDVADLLRKHGAIECERKDRDDST